MQFVVVMVCVLCADRIPMCGLRLQLSREVHGDCAQELHDVQGGGRLHAEQRYAHTQRRRQRLRHLESVTHVLSSFDVTFF